MEKVVCHGFLTQIFGLIMGGDVSWWLFGLDIDLDKRYFCLGDWYSWGDNDSLYRVKYDLIHP